MRIIVQGAPWGSTFTLETSFDMEEWSTVETVTTTYDRLQVTDWRELLAKKQFYRLVVPRRR